MRELSDFINQTQPLLYSTLTASLSGLNRDRKARGRWLISAGRLSIKIDAVNPLSDRLQSPCAITADCVLFVVLKSVKQLLQSSKLSKFPREKIRQQLERGDGVVETKRPDRKNADYQVRDRRFGIATGLW